MAYFLTKVSVQGGSAELGQKVWLWDDTATATEFTLEYLTTDLIGPQPDKQRLSCLWQYQSYVPYDWFLEEYSLQDGMYQSDRPSYAEAMPQSTERLHGVYLDNRAVVHSDGVHHLLRGRAVVGGDVTLYKSTVGGYEVLATVGSEFAVGETAISPDGTKVAVCATIASEAAPSTQQLHAFDWESGTELPLGSWWLSCGETARPFVSSVCWSPDSNLLAVVFRSEVEAPLPSNPAESYKPNGKLVVLDTTGTLVSGPAVFSDGSGYSFEGGYARGWTSEGRIVVVLAGGRGFTPAWGNPDSGPVRIYQRDGGTLVAVGNIPVATPEYPYHTVTRPHWTAVVPGTELFAIQQVDTPYIQLWDMVDRNLHATLTGTDNLVSFTDADAGLFVVPPLPGGASPPEQPTPFWTHFAHTTEIL